MTRRSVVLVLVLIIAAGSIALFIILRSDPARPESNASTAGEDRAGTAWDASSTRSSSASSASSAPSASSASSASAPSTSEPSASCTFGDSSSGRSEGFAAAGSTGSMASVDLGGFSFVIGTTIPRRTSAQPIDNINNDRTRATRASGHANQTPRGRQAAPSPVDKVVRWASALRWSGGLGKYCVVRPDAMW